MNKIEFDDMYKSSMEYILSHEEVNKSDEVVSAYDISKLTRTPDMFFKNFDKYSLFMKNLHNMNDFEGVEVSTAIYNGYIYMNLVIVRGERSYKDVMISYDVINKVLDIVSDYDELVVEYYNKYIIPYKDELNTDFENLLAGICYYDEFYDIDECHDIIYDNFIVECSQVGTRVYSKETGNMFFDDQMTDDILKRIPVETSSLDEETLKRLKTYEVVFGDESDDKTLQRELLYNYVLAYDEVESNDEVINLSDLVSDIDDALVNYLSFKKHCEIDFTKTNNNSKLSFMYPNKELVSVNKRVEDGVVLITYGVAIEHFGRQNYESATFVLNDDNTISVSDRNDNNKLVNFMIKEYLFEVLCDFEDFNNNRKLYDLFSKGLSPIKSKDECGIISSTIHLGEVCEDSSRDCVELNIDKETYNTKDLVSPEVVEFIKSRIGIKYTDHDFLERLKDYKNSNYVKDNNSLSLKIK